MKLHPTQIRNIKKNFGIILFITILIASFIALNAASGLLFSTHKLDLTKDQRYTLHPQTVSILQNMTKPVTINIYYSSSISKDLKGVFCTQGCSFPTSHSFSTLCRCLQAHPVHIHSSFHVTHGFLAAQGSS